MYATPENFMIKNRIENVSPAIAVMMNTAAGTVENVSLVIILKDGARRSLIMRLKQIIRYAESIRRFVAHPVTGERFTLKSLHWAVSVAMDRTMSTGARKESNVNNAMMKMGGGSVSVLSMT